MAGRDLAMDGARDDIARRQLGVGMHIRHEAAAGLVDQDRAFAAQGLGRERRGIAADVDGGGMELHELRIGDDGAGAGRHAEAFAARFQRIGRHRVERAKAAGRKDDGRTRKKDQPRVGADAGTREQAGDAAVLHRQFDGVKAFEQRDRRRGQRAFGERARNLRAGAVAFDVHDAVGAVRGLAAQRQRAVRLAVERRAKADEIVDACARLARDERGDVADRRGRRPRPSCRRHGSASCRLAHRGGDAALRPGAGARQARPRAGQHERRERAPASAP